MNKHFDVRDFAAGVFLVVTGLFVAMYASTHYEIGEASRMGPGYFPTVLGWTLFGLGIAIAMFSFRTALQSVEAPLFLLRPFLAVLLAIGAFGLLIDRVGLIPTTLIMTVIVAYANRQFQLRRAVALGVALSVISWAIFSLGLQMTLPVFVIPGG